MDFYRVFLYNKAMFLCYPSDYEGFGIPPLEAMSVDTDCIVSDIPVHREVYNGAVHYINPREPDVDLDRILGEKLSVSKEEILNKYSWENSAVQWLQLIEKK